MAPGSDDDLPPLMRRRSGARRMVLTDTGRPALGREADGSVPLQVKPRAHGSERVKRPTTGAALRAWREKAVLETRRQAMEPVSAPPERPTAGPPLGPSAAQPRGLRPRVQLPSEPPAWLPPTPPRAPGAAAEAPPTRPGAADPGPRRPGVERRARTRVAMRTPVTYVAGTARPSIGHVRNLSRTGLLVATSDVLPPIDARVVVRVPFLLARGHHVVSYTARVVRHVADVEGRPAFAVEASAVDEGGLADVVGAFLRQHGAE